MGAKRLGYGGETTRVENRGETTRGESTREETSWGRNVLIPLKLVSGTVGTTIYRKRRFTRRRQFRSFARTKC